MVGIKPKPEGAREGMVDVRQGRMHVLIAPCVKPILEVQLRKLQLFKERMEHTHETTVVEARVVLVFGFVD
jgi:hypothetical protein